MEILTGIAASLVFVFTCGAMTVVLAWLEADREAKDSFYAALVFAVGLTGFVTMALFAVSPVKSGYEALPAFLWMVFISVLGAVLAALLFGIAVVLSEKNKGLLAGLGMMTVAAIPACCIGSYTLVRWLSS